MLHAANTPPHTRRASIARKFNELFARWDKGSRCRRAMAPRTSAHFGRAPGSTGSIFSGATVVTAAETFYGKARLKHVRAPTPTDRCGTVVGLQRRRHFAEAARHVGVVRLDLDALRREHRRLPDHPVTKRHLEDRVDAGPSARAPREHGPHRGAELCHASGGPCGARESLRAATTLLVARAALWLGLRLGPSIELARHVRGDHRQRRANAVRVHFLHADRAALAA